MTWVQFWLLIATIYDAAHRHKHGGYNFIPTVCLCLLAAFYCSDITQAYLEGLLGS